MVTIEYNDVFIHDHTLKQDYCDSVAVLITKLAKAHIENKSISLIFIIDTKMPEKGNYEQVWIMKNCECP